MMTFDLSALGEHDEPHVTLILPHIQGALQGQRYLMVTEEALVWLCKELTTVHRTVVAEDFT